MKKFKIDVKWVVGNDPADIDKAIDENTACAYKIAEHHRKQSEAQCPGHSCNRADVAHRHGIPLIVDNTFGMGGYICRPIALELTLLPTPARSGLAVTAHRWVASSSMAVISTGARFGQVRALPSSPHDGYHGLRILGHLRVQSPLDQAENGQHA